MQQSLAQEDLSLKTGYLVCPVEKGFPLSGQAWVVGIDELPDLLKGAF